MGDDGGSREVERLRRVYAQYDATHRGSTLWNTHNPGNRAIVAERRRAVADLLRTHRLGPESGASVLEIGCASGDFLEDLLTLGFAAAKLHAVDLLEDKVRATRERFPDIDIRVANAECLAEGDATFGVVVLATVISSIFDARMAATVAAEAARVLRPGGAVLWYDMRYDNPANRNVRGVRRDELERLFAGFRMDLRPVTLLPPLVRRLGAATSAAYPVLAAIRPLRTHFVGLLTKPDA